MTAEKNREIIANIHRLNERMDREGFAALVLRSGKNFTYLAGFPFPGTLGRHLEFPDSPREPLLIWPRRGDPILVLNHQAAPLAERDSWVRRVEVYDGYAQSPYGVTAEILRESGLHEEKLGFEPDYVSARRWKEIRRLLPRAEIADCGPMMDEVRWIKTPGEVDLIKRGADILDEAYLEVFPTVRPGDTERQVHSRIIQSCIARGAEWAHGMLNPLRNTVIYGGEGDLPFERGDIIRNDYVAYFRGYPGHQSRTVVLGPPTEEQKRIYRTVREIYRGTMDQCRPGVKANAIYRYASEAFRRQGYKQRLNLVGHSVGPWWHQQAPYLVPNCEQELEEGMVLALEPHADFWHIQDMVLVTADGPRLISDRIRTDEMLRAGGG